MSSSGTNSPDRTWVLQKFLAELTGQTENAFNELRKKNRISKGYHWVKKNGRIWIHLPRFYKWLENTEE